MGCDKGSSDNNNAQMNAYCMQNPYACQQNVYNQGYNNGYYPYQYGYGGAFHYTQNSAYLCNCPAGTMPTYNTYGGLGCVSNNNMNAGFGAYAYFSWNMGASNNQWMNIPQVSNYTGYNQSNCYNGVVQSCLVNQPSTCSAGYTCRASSAQTNLGLCVSNTNQGSYGNVYR